MEFTQPSCVCPVHCPGEGLQERQEAASEKRFWILDRGHHVQSFAELGESIDYVREHKRCDLVHVLLQPSPRAADAPKTMEDVAAWKAQHFNPLAEQLWEQNYAAIDAVTALLPEDVNLLATCAATSLGGKGLHPISDDECRFATVEISPRRFDLTGDIPQQVAQILEELALELLQSAVWIRNPPDAEEDTSSAELAAAG